MTLFLQLILNGVVAGSALAFSAMGFAVIYATARQFHIAQAAVYTFAGYAAYVIISHYHLPIWLALGVAAVVAAALGVVIQVLIYEPMIRSGASQMTIWISSLGAVVVLEEIAAWMFGNDPLFVTMPAIKQQLTLAGLTINPLRLGVVVALPVVWLALHLLLNRTRPGRQLLATANNPGMAQVIGIDVDRVYRLSYLIGSVAIVPAAVFALLDVGTIPHGGTSVFLLAAIAVFMGGVGSLNGAVLAAYGLGILQQVAVWKLPSEWQNGIVFTIFLVFILARPQGIFGARERSSGV